MPLRPIGWGQALPSPHGASTSRKTNACCARSMIQESSRCCASQRAPRRRTHDVHGGVLQICLAGEGEHLGQCRRACGRPRACARPGCCASQRPSPPGAALQAGAALEPLSGSQCHCGVAAFCVCLSFGVVSCVYCGRLMFDVTLCLRGGVCSMK